MSEPVNPPKEMRRVSASRLKSMSECGLAHKPGPFGVSEVMHIYLITNTVNGKRYVGRTTRENVSCRWNEHKKASRKGDPSIISRALNKHGIDAFTFEVIETVKDGHTLAKREAFYITHYDCLTPKGYNVNPEQPYAPRSPETCVKLSLCNQGVKKGRATTSIYHGVHRKGRSWVSLISKAYKDYTMTHTTEREAARCYDAMAIALYGRSARLNFPDDPYPQTQVDKVYERVTHPPATSIYRGVDYVTSRQKWRTVVSAPIAGRKTWVKMYAREEDAAAAYDRVSIHLLKVSQEALNFPEMYSTYLAEDLASFAYRKPSSSRLPGVSYRSDKKTFRARLRHGDKVYHCGDFKTEDEAWQAIQVRRAALEGSS